MPVRVLFVACTAGNIGRQLDLFDYIRTISLLCCRDLVIMVSIVVPSELIIVLKLIIMVGVIIHHVVFGYVPNLVSRAST